MALLPLPAPYDLFVALGDSITADFPDTGQPDNAWFKGAGGFSDQLTARIRLANPVTIPSSLSRLAAARIAGARNQSQMFSVINQGVGGSKIGDINVATMVAPFAPKYVLLATGVNDSYQSTTGSAFQTSYIAVLDALAALKPKPYVLCLNILCFGEQWTISGGAPAWGPNPLDADIADKNSRLVTLTASYPNVMLIDQRSRLLAWEATNNPLNLCSGRFCYDTTTKPPYGVLGVHTKNGSSSANFEDLRPIMGTWAMGAFA